ncbi:cell division protein FtsQ/DivIB [Pseudonocardia nigra]|uniref:cell division protein FtsQ/DivIB n=1 Tax=Pseudonocardia nigra TaxID=1921578 RepID=UPI001C5F1178|nr:FtsQ-type POTRA domain-containing protein [Pseudonocardia nigra]
MTRQATRRPPPARPRPRPVSPGHYRRRRLAAVLAGVLLLVGLALTGRVLLYDAGLADVEDVQVTGTAAVPVDAVLAAAAVVPGGPLAAVDTEAVAARVAELPGVATAEVARGWPNTVTIAVTERVPVATARTPDGLALVDATGVVYRAASDAELPRLTFPAATGDPATVGAVAVLTALPDTVRAQVRSVEARVARDGAPPQVTLELTEDRQVRWGAPDRAAEKSAALVPLLTQPGRVYDVASPDLPTIRS